MKKILYVVCAVPAVSATFIDREIRALTAAGYQIRTVSRGTPVKGELPQEIIDYYKDTLYLDRVPTWRLFAAQLHTVLRKPLAWCRIISLIMSERELLNRRGRPRLFKHLLQAGYVYTRVKDQPIDHVHAHFLNAPTTIALCLSYLLDIPFTFTLHGSNIHLDPLMLETKLKLCKCAVSVSRFNVEYLKKKYGDHVGDKMHVIHCGIDPEVYQPAPRYAAGAPPAVLAVGRLIEIKGFRYLLEACAILKEKGLRFSCLIAGDGEERGRLLTMRSELGVEDVVRFLGSRTQDEVLKLLQDASVFVLPSVVLENGGREGIPVALMEAMSCELPVVSTRTAGIPELVEDGEEGILVAHSSAGELASAIEFLLKNPAAGEAMGKRARAKVVREFNVRNIPAQFKEIFG